MNKKSKEKISKLSSIENEKLGSIFEESFRENLKNNRNIQIDEFECLVEKDFINKKTRVVVTVFGMAGTTSRKSFHDKKSGKIIAGAERILIRDSDGKELGFFVLEDSFDINANDYSAHYVEG